MFSLKSELKRATLVIAVGLALLAPALAVTTGQSYAAGTTGACAKSTFFGLVPWYQYLTVTKTADPLDHTYNCDITTDFSSSALLSRTSPILLILLAVIDDLLRIAGLIAIGFVIYAGIRYTTSQGSPDQTAEAQSTIVNALIGLAIALIAVALVSFVGSALGG